MASRQGTCFRRAHLREGVRCVCWYTGVGVDFVISPSMPDDDTFSSLYNTTRGLLWSAVRALNTDGTTTLTCSVSRPIFRFIDVRVRCRTTGLKRKVNSQRERRGGVPAKGNPGDKLFHHVDYSPGFHENGELIVGSSFYR